MSRIVCIGGSAGGFEAVRTLLALLPRDLPAAVLVVLHLAARSPSFLAQQFAKDCALAVGTARDGEPLQNGRVYVAPPDYHLMIERRYVRVLAGPKENFSRPAIDPLFRSAALYHSSRVVGVLLSGELDDGTAGLWAIKRAGGVTLVQEPSEAGFTSMPLSAISAVRVDAILPIQGLAERVTELAFERVPTTPRLSSATRQALEVENDYAFLRPVPAEQLEKLGAPTAMICAECGGPLWRMKHGPHRYRCHVGHSYSETSFFSAQVSATDRAMWQAARSLTEEIKFAALLLTRPSLDPTYRKLVRERKNKAERRLEAVRKELD